MAILGLESLSGMLLKEREIEIPEWGGVALVRELTSAEVDTIRQVAMLAVDTKTSKVLDAGALYRFQLRLIAAGWINPDGSRVLKDDQIDKLRDVSNAVTQRLATAIMQLSGLDDTAQAVAEKN